MSLYPNVNDPFPIGQSPALRVKSSAGAYLLPPVSAAKAESYRNNANQGWVDISLPQNATDTFADLLIIQTELPDQGAGSRDLQQPIHHRGPEWRMLEARPYCILRCVQQTSRDNQRF